jgi:hypothetical protein
MLHGSGYLRRLDAPKRALSHLISELDDLDDDDRDRIMLAQRAFSIRGPVLVVPNAVRAMQTTAESDIRRIWAKYHADLPMEAL